MASSRTLIASQTLASSAASVTFSSIPSGYKDLILKVSARCDDTDTWAHLHFQLNSDTTTAYSYTFLYGSGSSAGSSFTSNSPSGRSYYSVDASGATANTFGSAEIYIPSYTASQNKPIATFGVTETNSSVAGDANIGIAADLWRNTAAITSIKLGAISNFSTVNFIAGSSFTLYGLN